MVGQLGRDLDSTLVLSPGKVLSPDHGRAGPPFERRMLPPTFLCDATYDIQVWPARILDWPWVVQELLVAKPRRKRRFRSWSERKCVDRLLFSYHNEERWKGRIYQAAIGAAEYRIIVLFGAGILRPEIRAGSALAAVARPGRRTTIMVRLPPCPQAAGARPQGQVCRAQRAQLRVRVGLYSARAMIRCLRTVPQFMSYFKLVGDGERATIAALNTKEKNSQ